MIPPVEERAVRSCKGNLKGGVDECVFCLGFGIGSNNEWVMLCNLRRFVDDLGYTNRDGVPCNAHFTVEEMEELIDSGRV